MATSWEQLEEADYCSVSLTVMFVKYTLTALYCPFFLSQNVSANPLCIFVSGLFLCTVAVTETRYFIFQR